MKTELIDEAKIITEDEEEKKAESIGDDDFSIFGLDSKAAIEPEKIKEPEKKSRASVDFMDSSYSERITQRNHADIEDETRRENADDFLKDLEEETKKEKDREPDPMSFEDCYDFASGGIETLDTVISSLCKWISDEDSSRKFEIEQKKKKHLSSMLTKVLVKHQLKMSIEVMFALSVIMTFSTPISMAFQIRRQKNNKTNDFTENNEFGERRENRGRKPNPR